jgi:ABC-2 type transport system permease protein
MNVTALAIRNEKEALRNPLSLALTILLPAGLLLVLGSIGGKDSATLNATFLTPGVALFGFVMVMFTSSMLLAHDRETALFARLLTAPLRASDFVLAYAIPALIVATLLAVLVFGLGATLGMSIEGNALLVVIVLVVMAVFYVALGVAVGALLSLNATTGVYSAVLLLTIFGGAWFNLDDIGGPVKAVAGFLPFSHALDAMRAVMIDGAGFSDISGDLVWIAAFTVAAVAVAVGSIRRRMVE